MNLKIYLLICMLHIAQTTDAATCQINSEEYKVPLMELYTSQGCSSCPPADRFLSALNQNDYGPTKVVALALHVDYWDYIGWKDAFAQAKFTQRQKSIAATNALNTIYTPQFVVDGEDARQWFRSGKQVLDNIDRINQTKPGADIEMKLDQTQNTVAVSTRITLQNLETTKGKKTVVYLALYENSLSVEIKRGENEGKKLHHDNVVREMAGPFVILDKGTINIEHAFTLEKAFQQPNMGIAAFVQSVDDGTILQSLASPLCEK